MTVEKHDIVDYQQATNANHANYCKFYCYIFNESFHFAGKNKQKIVTVKNKTFASWFERSVVISTLFQYNHSSTVTIFLKRGILIFKVVVFCVK